jgi:hypothetical protein
MGLVGDLDEFLLVVAGPQHKPVLHAFLIGFL